MPIIWLYFDNLAFKLPSPGFDIVLKHKVGKAMICTMRHVNINFNMMDWSKSKTLKRANNVPQETISVFLRKYIQCFLLILGKSYTSY